MKKTKNKSKKAGGGILNEKQLAGMGTGAGLAGSLVSTFLPPTSIGGGIASGALSGAASLSALGPAGMLAGAVVGGVKGAFGAKKAKAAEKQQKQLELEQGRLLGAENIRAGMSFKHGGKMLAKHLKVEEGGSLNAISNDAVEVKANNPTETDSVELEQAYVDHNEVIDSQKRVFSDEVIAPSGKSIAKEAKKLEKMKSKSSRFTDANNFIDSKLDSLFEYQEAVKPKPTSNTAFAKGGKMKGKYVFGTPDLTGKDFKNDLEQESFFQKYTSGLLDTEAGPVDMSNLEFDQETMSAPTNKKGINTNRLLDIGTSLATFAPNIVNAKLQKQLKGPAQPLQQGRVRLDRLDPNAQLREIDRDAALAGEAVKKSTSQAANIASASGSLLAKKLAAKNQVFGQTNNANTQIANQESMVNADITGRNLGKRDIFNQATNEFANRKLQLTSENVANAAGKIQAMNRERNMRNLDKEKFDILMERYGELPEEMRSKYKTFGDNKYGGKIGKADGGTLPDAKKQVSNTDKAQYRRMGTPNVAGIVTDWQAVNKENGVITYKNKAIGEGGLTNPEVFDRTNKDDMFGATNRNLFKDKRVKDVTLTDVSRDTGYSDSSVFGTNMLEKISIEQPKVLDTTIKKPKTSNILLDEARKKKPLLNRSYTTDKEGGNIKEAVRAMKRINSKIQVDNREIEMRNLMNKKANKKSFR